MTLTAADILQTRRQSTADIAARSQAYDVTHTINMIYAANCQHADLIAADFRESVDRCDTYHEKQKLIRRWQMIMRDCDTEE